MEYKERRSGTAALEKGLGILERIADAPTPPRFTDLVGATNLPKGTLHRMLQALLARQLISLDTATQTYHVGLRTLEMAHRTWHEMDIRKAAAAEISALGAETGETVHLAVRDASDVVYIDKVESGQSIRMFSAIGKRGPAYCTGVGKAMLAYLPPQELEPLTRAIAFKVHTPNTLTDAKALLAHLALVRERGYALDLEEHELGIQCAAAAIFDYRGRAIASVSVTGPCFRFNRMRLDATVPSVVETAKAVTRALGGAALRS
jgi:DNA-binding IclR family transcriptional regulator